MVSYIDGCLITSPTSMDEQPPNAFCQDQGSILFLLLSMSLIGSEKQS